MRNSKPRPALLAYERSVSGVGPFVILQVLCLREGFVTLITRVRTFLPVDSPYVLCKSRGNNLLKMKECFLKKAENIGALCLALYQYIHDFTR